MYCNFVNTVIQVGLSEITYEVSEGPGKELTICVNIVLGTVYSDSTTVRLVTLPYGASAGKST